MIFAIGHGLGPDEFQKIVPKLQRNSVVSLKIHYLPMFLSCRPIEKFQSRGEFRLESSVDLTAFVKAHKKC